MVKLYQNMFHWDTTVNAIESMLSLELQPNKEYS